MAARAALAPSLPGVMGAVPEILRVFFFAAPASFARASVTDCAAILLLHLLWGSGSGARFPPAAENIDAAAGTPRPIRSLKVCPAGLLARRSIAIPLAFPRQYPQWPNKNEESLAAYSCGGSCGFKPHSLFIALSREPMHD
jgi:hypothetical protein